MDSAPAVVGELSVKPDRDVEVRGAGGAGGSLNAYVAHGDESLM